MHDVHNVEGTCLALPEEKRVVFPLDLYPVVVAQKLCHVSAVLML